jgi:hypothetical protein
MGIKTYHIVMSREFDLDRFDRDFAAERSPRHSMSLLRHKLGAIVHQPVGRRAYLADKLLGKIFSATAQQVALGRDLSKRLTEDDVVFAVGEDVGYPLAFALRNVPHKPRLVVDVHNPKTPRSRFALRLLHVQDSIALFVATTWSKVDFVRRYAGLPNDQICCIRELTDTIFFSPGPASPEKDRMIVGSCGLEQRDYVTLAEATADMDVDVRICAASANARGTKGTFPAIMPPNMVARYYSFPELLQLYRDSDVIVIPLRHNRFQAGQTAIMEAMACGRPVVTTEAEGMVEDFARDGLIRVVPAKNPGAMRKAIEEVLRDPEEAAKRAHRGRERILDQFNVESYVERLSSLLQHDQDLNCDDGGVDTGY